VQGAGPALLEREREFALLTDAIDRASALQAAVVVIDGAPGVGKTSLLGWTDALARDRGFQVLRARGGNLEQTLGWGVARQLFEDLVVRATPASRRSLLRSSAALSAPVFGLEHSQPDQRASIKDFHLEHGLYWLVCNLAARTPLALLIDDIQWCDTATLEWLLYLVRRCERLPLVVVLASRLGELGAPSEVLELIASEPPAERVALTVLGLDATEALLERAYESSVDRDFSLACHEWTGGNPLFVSELAAELATEGIHPTAASAPNIKTLTPEAISRVVLLRLARLSERARTLARAVSVLESAAHLHYASDLAEQSMEDATVALDELLAARVLTAERPLRFAHPLIGGVVYEDIPSARQGAMHKRAAELLVHAGADAGLIAAHLLRSPPAADPAVVAELRRSAEGELERGSASTAVALLRRASAEPPAADEAAELLRELGRAELMAGDAAALPTLRQAIATTTDVQERARTALMLTTFLIGSDDGRAAVEVAHAAAAELGWEDVDLRLQLEASIVNAARSDSALIALIPEHLRTARERANGDGLGTRLIAVQLSWAMTAIGAPAEVAVGFARDALADGRLIAQAPNRPDAYLGAIHMLSLNDQLAEAESHFEHAVELARRNGSAPAYAACSCFRASAAFLAGRLDDGELFSRDALRTAGESRGLELIRGLAGAYLALALIARGAVKEASGLIADDLEQLEQSRSTWASELMFATGCAAVADGRIDEAAEWLLGCGRRALSWGVVNPAWLPWRSEAALALLRSGNRNRARELSAEELELARRCGVNRAVGIALRCRGLVEGGKAGIQLLRESEAVLAASPARLEHATTLIELGCALRRSNSRAEARAVLERGLAVAQRCGADPLAERARTELVAVGARPRSVVRIGVDALTPSERRVCELAAAGKSNPEIAQLLFVTRATVESHLHSAYRRLDISKRGDLSAALSNQEQ
jgi:DNA-binding CsgD family transcriptional regulator